MEKDPFVCAIREIPFRISAQKRGLNEKKFVQGIHASMIGRLFLHSDCEERFQLMASKIFTHFKKIIEDFTSEKLMDIYEAIKEEQKRGHTAMDLYSWLTAQNDFYDPRLALKILGEIEPSGYSREYLEYINTSYLFFAENIEFFYSGFDFMYGPTVDFCLETFFAESTLFDAFLKDSTIH